MANPTITGSSYAGEFAGKYLAAALLSADTLDSGTVTKSGSAIYFPLSAKANLDACVIR